jgi:translation initiation factor 2B subunit (eIF-2B alpha/beta/delta family)
LVEFTGVDLAENESIPFTISNIVYDITSPVFTNIIPSTGSYFNSPDISYEINEDLHSGSFSWDYGWRKEFKYDFELDELGNGGHVLKSVLPQDVLDEDRDNNLIIIGTDLAGNSSHMELSNVVYDITPPELIIKYPETNDILNTFEFAFTISEV